MNTPQPVYDALPYSYIGAGVCTIVLMESGLRLLPAFLLIAAGLLVLAWRRSARLTEAAIQRGPQRRQAAKLRGS